MHPMLRDQLHFLTPLDSPYLVLVGGVLGVAQERCAPVDTRGSSLMRYLVGRPGVKADIPCKSAQG